MTDDGTVNQNPEPDPEHAEKARSAAGATLSWFRDLFLSVLIAIVVILFLYQPVKVEGTSMMPSLQNDERIFINKFVYRFGISDIGRGDTVVFLYPGDPTKSYIKRVIGIPGDTIEIDNGKVIVNKKPIAEPYVAEDNRDQITMALKTVPTDQYFVLGDHRSSSNDSRSWGWVPRQNIYGKAVFVYWPLEDLGAVH
jgi:signal peptidase I